MKAKSTKKALKAGVAAVGLVAVSLLPTGCATPGGGAGGTSAPAGGSGGTCVLVVCI
jgi:hypothetical protein